MTEIRISRKAKHDLIQQRAYLLDKFGPAKLKSVDDELKVCMGKLEQRPTYFPLFPG